jgi:hypothetical protein
LWAVGRESECPNDNDDDEILFVKMLIHASE